MSALSKYKTYPEYKDSGVEWLGKIPSHWEAKRLSNFFIERREKVSDKDYPALSVTKLGIVPQLETAAKTDAGDNRKLVLKNDFVINSRSDRKGSSGTSPYNGSVSLISIVLEPKNILPKFAHHLLRSIPFQEEFYRFGKGIVADLWSTNSSEMKNILLPELDKIEQAKIAQFLDHETAKIDQLIEKQQTLIELLKEKRQAVISHAVTKGLDPNVKMKDSGVEWLGEVPEHWIVSSLKYQCDKITDGAHISPDLSNGIHLFVSTKDILKNGNIDFDNALLTSKISYNYLVQTGCKPSKNDILFSKDGTIGVTAITPKNIDFVVASSLIIISTKKDTHNVRFFNYFLHSNSTKEQVESFVKGAALRRISLLNIKKIVGSFPPLHEQNKIVEYLQNQTSKFELLVQKAEQQIELMKERRTALISAAVTGKIDVRDWQPEQ